MCEPVTLSLIGGVFSAVGTVASGMMQAQAASANARALDEQAQLRKDKGEFDAIQAENKYRRTFGNAVASGASTGLNLDTFGDVFADMATESALEQKSIRYGAAHEARNLEFQADAQRYQGQAAMIGGMFGAAGGLLSGAGKAFGSKGGGFSLGLT